ncbi:hypothetical protein KCU81_g3668, partial [Aureobasidium melanogenum]|uniref:Uncharacterized protein n=1 Tax=Aureobasidium melanogenum (strain CBS 110374) TaxID=1043003 RepID=A0A074VJ48_AURM1
MALPDHTKPILQSSNHEIKQTLLHGPPPGQQFPFLVPTHRRRIDLPLAQRSIIETNLAHQTTTRPSISWSWEKTEKYVRHKDTLMLEYLYDYPVVEWVIEAEEARYAVETFLAREEMRRLGASVFAEDTPFSWWMRGEVAPVDDNLSISNKGDVVEDEQEEVGEVEEMEVEQETATPEPLLASPNISRLADPAASEESRESEDEQTSDQSPDDTTETPIVNPEPRRSTRITEQKLKEEHDQQAMEESLKPIPHTTQTKRLISLPKRSKQKSVQSRQQENQRPRRRSTRVSAKRTFADEPWSEPRYQTN